MGVLGTRVRARGVQCNADVATTMRGALRIR